MNAQMETLQSQVDNLYASLNALRTGGDMPRVPTSSERSSVSQIPAAQSASPDIRHRHPYKHPSFRGPTSSAFSLDVAKTTLHNMGYHQSLSVDEGVLTHDPTPNASPSVIQTLPNTSNNAGNGDPIWALSKEEIIRLCRVYEEEMGIMYPVADIEQVIAHGANLHEFVDAAMSTGFPNPNSKEIVDGQSCVLKMVLAISTVVEGDGRSEIGYRLFESVKGAADKSLHSETIEIKSLPFLVLVVSQVFCLLIALLQILGHPFAAFSLLSALYLY